MEVFFVYFLPFIMATLAAKDALNAEHTDAAEISATDTTVDQLVDRSKSFIGGLFDGPATSVQVVIGDAWYSVKEAALGAIEACRSLGEQEVRRQLHAILRHTEARHRPTGWELPE